ncbi:T9SS type A sorting domain-containing protein [Kordia sp.]|uniref:T9SS type A sorting domain-containing protein n=1 Tax=Kordia sp. TaxID=1965332 RepID=UPI003B5CFB42
MKKKLLFYSILFFNLTAAFSQWNQVGQTLTGTRLQFGNSVSVSGDGMRIATTDTANNGYVNVYEFQGTTWQLVGNPIGPLFIGGNSPLDLDYDGDRLVISDVKGNTDSYGSCFLTYSFNGTDWEQLGNAHICGDFPNLILENYRSDAKINDDGNRIMVVAAEVGNLDVYDSGFVEVYELISNEWTLMGSPFLIGFNTSGNRGVTMTMSADGSKIAFGVPAAPTILGGNSIPTAHEFGTVRAYEWQTNTWVSIGSTALEANNPPNFGDNYGSGISFNALGDRIAVGTLGDDITMSNAGKVEVYERNSTDGNWSQIGNTIYGETVDHEVGRAVALNRAGNVLSIGASGTDSDGSYSVKVYRLVNDTWVLVNSPIVFGSNITPWYASFYGLYHPFMEFSETGRLALAFPYDTGQGKVQVFENPSLSVNERFAVQVKLYPNPFTDVLSLELDTKEQGIWSIFSIQGRQLLQGDFSSKQLQLDLSSIKSKGVYFLKIQTSKGILTKKVIKA